MNFPNCDDVADLIDLYAARECDAAQEKAVRAHLATCPGCRAELDESRRLIGLLDVHFGHDTALSRLGVRLKAESRPARSLMPRQRLIHRFAGVAALLLVPFGLGYLLAPLASSPRPVALQLVLAQPEAKLEHVPALPSRAHDRDVPQKVAKGKKPRELPPRVDLDLVVTNAGRTPIELDVGGPAFRCVLDLRGPAVERHVVPNPTFIPFRPRTAFIAPGGSLTLKLERLASQTGDQVQYLYPTAPGDYVLRVRIEAAARRAGVCETVRLSAGPRTLRLP